ncbi:MAG: hypothetical protein JWM98_2237 [Thermoleophilia bacterium]|nr:hypothetical protein [Thermoleophilia bacterium]
MEDLTLALITLTSFVLLFVVAIFADRAGTDAEERAEPALVPVSDHAPAATAVRSTTSRHIDADVA